VKKGIILSVVFALMALSASRAEINIRHLLNFPEEYEGNTVVLENTKLNGEISRNRHFGFYCLDLEIQGKHVPGHLYRSQLNFVIISEALAGKLIHNLKQPMESRGKKPQLMDHISSATSYLVRLTCTIERFQDYWVANVKKIELYGHKGTVIETIE